MNDTEEIFRGIVVDNGFDKYSDSINAFDFAFYLNENDDIIQFKNIRADDAIKEAVQQTWCACRIYCRHGN